MTRRNVSFFGLISLAVVVAVLVVVAVRSPGAAAPDQVSPVIVTVTETVGAAGVLPANANSRGSAIVPG